MGTIDDDGVDEDDDEGEGEEAPDCEEDPFPMLATCFYVRLLGRVWFCVSSHFPL